MAKAPAKKTAVKKPTKKVVIKKPKPLALKKPVAKAPAKKAVKKSTTPDYFKLPFEVYYSDHVGVNQMEFKSDVKCKSFRDVKVVHQEQGGSWGLSLYCPKNNGPELYCCLTNGHDEVQPEWLDYLDEENIDFNSGTNYKVVVEGNEIRFEYLTDDEEDEDSEEYLDIDNMDYCCSYTFMTYELGDSCPDYIILEADDTRIKVNLDGYLLDENDDATEEQIIDVEKLIESDELSDYEVDELWDAKNKWVESILKKDFPKDTNLSLSFKTK